MYAERLFKSPNLIGVCGVKTVRLCITHCTKTNSFVDG